MKRLKLCFTIIINILCLSNIWSQDLGQLMQESRQSLNIGDTLKARSSLLRVLYLDKSYQYASVAYELLGDIEVGMHSFSKAQIYYDNAIAFEKEIGFENKILFKKTVLFLLSRDYGFAAASASRIQTSENDSCLFRFKILTQAANYINNGDLDVAERLYLQLAKHKNDSVFISGIFNANSKIEKKSLRKARTLSKVFPGAGQLYLGDLRNSANSFILVGGWTFLIVNTSIVYSPASAFLTIFPWWFRYYNGGIKKNNVIYNSKKKEHQQYIYITLKEYFKNNKYYCEVNF